MALPEAIAKRGETSKPPNLRTGKPPRICANCKYYRPKSLTAGVCRLYGSYRVQAGQTCDSYSPKAGS